MTRPGEVQAGEVAARPTLVRVATYAFDEALNSLWRARRSSVFSVATIASPVLVLGVFLLVTSNLERLVVGWSSTAEMSVYLADDVTEPDRAAVDALLAADGLIAGREYVSKAQALARFRRDFADLETVVAGFADNPFPASFEVQIRTGLERGPALDTLATQLASMEGVEDVRYDRQWLERVVVAVTFLRGLGTLFASLLVLGATLTVANVMRLTFTARRDEVEIMRLVGAPSVFIRGPFIIEGALQGGVGGAIALLALWVGYLFARAQYGVLTENTLGLGRVAFLPWSLALLLLVGGIVVGGVGGAVATRNTPSV